MVLERGAASQGQGTAQKPAEKLRGELLLRKNQPLLGHGIVLEGRKSSRDRAGKQKGATLPGNFGPTVSPAEQPGGGPLNPPQPHGGEAPAGGSAAWEGETITVVSSRARRARGPARLLCDPLCRAAEGAGPAGTRRGGGARAAGAVPVRTRGSADPRVAPTAFVYFTFKG